MFENVYKRMLKSSNFRDFIREENKLWQKAKAKKSPSKSPKEN